MHFPNDVILLLNCYKIISSASQMHSNKETTHNLQVDISKKKEPQHGSFFNVYSKLFCLLFLQIDHCGNSCCNTDKGIYYYTTYENSGICAVDMHREDLNGNQLISYPLVKEPSIEYQN